MIPEHTSSCVARFERAQDARDAFAKAHPDHCVKCGGNGCDECEEDGLCPWCGDMLYASACPCGWETGKTGLPPEPECTCFEPERRTRPHEHFD